MDLDQDIMISMYGSKEAYDDVYQNSLRAVRGLTEEVKRSGNLYTIEGSDHMMFTDIGLFFGFSPLRQLIKCLEITNALTSAFFDQHLKRGNKYSMESLVSKVPELKKVELK